MRQIVKTVAIIVFLICSLILGQLFLNESDTAVLRSDIIDYYNSLYKTAHARKKNEAIGFGYTGCQDRKYDAIQLISRLNRSFVPRLSPKLSTLQDLVETFAFYFREGAATELFMESREAFEELINIAKGLGLPTQTTFGGHAPHMALRASKEGCKAILVAGLGEQEKQTLRKLDGNSLITVSAQQNSSAESDVHLILEYSAGTFANVSSPRANRYPCIVWRM